MTCFHRAKALFLEASRQPQVKLDAFLDDRCGDDADLRKEVESLLAADSEELTISCERSVNQVDSVSCQPGDMIGPYLLISEIGHGGMGVVYLAQHTGPLRREVALKIIRPGFDSKTFIDRFQAEVENLARMKDKGIAHILNAGMTENGLPWFSMDHVEQGIPITTFCDEHKLDLAGRLAIFIKVCEAVQHAHGRLVVHRDLSPNNILVTVDNRGEAQPKIIDFGIATLLSDSPGDGDCRVSPGDRALGTPPYASPEQFAGQAKDIDTRTDVYSLGVILHELLAGCTHIERQQLQSTTWKAAAELLQQFDPPLASKRFAHLPPARQRTIARNRGTNIAALHDVLSRKFDWILRKATNRIQEDRYASPDALASDLRRHGESRLAEIITSTLASASQSILKDLDREVINTLYTIVLEDHVDELEHDPPLARALLRMCWEAHFHQAHWSDAEPILDRHLAIARDTLGNQHPETLEIIDNLGCALTGQGRLEEAKPLLFEALASRCALLGNEHPDTGASFNNVGVLLYDLGNYEEASPYLERNLEISCKLNGPDHLDTAQSLNLLGLNRMRQNHPEEAATLHRKAYESRLQHVGPDDPRTTKSKERMEEALALLADRSSTPAVVEIKGSGAVAPPPTGPSVPPTATASPRSSDRLRTGTWSAD